MGEFFSRDLPVEDIKPSLHPRTIREAAITELAESIRVTGLLEPIVVGENSQLIAGQRRLLAVQQLGWKTIPCRICDLDNGEAELATIDENLMREDYNEVERAGALARRKILYLAINPETRNVNVMGGPGRGHKSEDKTAARIAAVSFVADTATKTGKSERSIRLDVAIGEKLDPTAAAIVAELPAIADNKAELKALSELPPEQQRQVATAVAEGKAKSVRMAIKAAAEPDEPVADSLTGRMEAANSVLEGLARKITALIKEAESIDNPHLTDVVDGKHCNKHGRLATLVAQLKSAAGTVRACKGEGECRYCGGVGCVRCMKTGWLTKTALESAPEKKGETA